MSKNIKVVASLTTTPNRLNKLKNIILSVDKNKILDKIYINIPIKSSFDSKLYIIPSFLYELIPRVEVVRPAIDFGPVTKLLPLLSLIPKEEDVWLITLDDDELYDFSQVSLFLQNIAANDYDTKIIYGYKSLMLDKDNMLLEGSGMIIYHRSVFQDDFLEYILSFQTCNNCKYSDDVLINNYLAKHSLKRHYVKSNFYSSKYSLNYKNLNDSLEFGKNNNILPKEMRYERTINILKEKNQYYLKSE